jgi:hypothetical protein
MAARVSLREIAKTRAARDESMIRAFESAFSRHRSVASSEHSL